MSTRVRGSIKWASSSEDEDSTSDAKYAMKLRELRSAQQPTAAENEMVEPKKRGRGPSKRPCLNRNALMARENRQRKKAYLEKIENKLSFYQQENKTLMNTIRKQGIDIKRLSGEVAYLKSVLNNNTSITALLKTINDGLHKISSHKKNGTCLVSQPNLNGIEQKCSCPVNIRENMAKSQSTQSMFVNSTYDQYTEYNTVHNHLNGDYHETGRNCNCKSTMEKKLPALYSELDHTYTVSKNPTVDIKSEVDSKDTCNTMTTCSSMSQASEDSYVDTVKDFDNVMTMSQANLSEDIVKKESEPLNTEFDQLPSFSMDIFEDLPKCDDIINSIDSLQDASGLFNDEDAFQNLDNTGICLHVNSDKVSLEFCSICHLNSKNSGLN